LHLVVSAVGSTVFFCQRVRALPSAALCESRLLSRRCGAVFRYDGVLDGECTPSSLMPSNRAVFSSYFFLLRTPGFQQMLKLNKHPIERVEG